MDFCIVPIIGTMTFVPKNGTAFQGHLPMSQPQQNKEIINNILYSALCLCFKKTENALSIEQLIQRRFAPSAPLAKHYVAALMDDEKIKGRIIPIIGSHPHTSAKYQHIIIEKPSLSAEELNTQIAQAIHLANAAASEFPRRQTWRDQLTTEILCGDCIEYANFYANRNALTIIDADPFNPRLQILVMNLELAQVYMLIWKSIMQHRDSLTTSHIHFADLMEASFESYNEYIGRGIEIKKYNRPRPMKRSILAGIVWQHHPALLF